MSLPSPVDFSVLPDVSHEHPELDASAQRYAAHALARERGLRTIFGETDPPNTVYAPVDPNLLLNWAGGCILRFPPQADRTAWYYVTHGLAQPDDPDEPLATDDPVSGFGIELVISTPSRAEWAPDLLLHLVRYLLFQPTARLILPGDRFPCFGPLVPNTESLLRDLLAVRSPRYPNELLLPAGACTLVHLVGATDDEIARACAWGTGYGGSEILERVFNALGVGTLTDPSRPSVASLPQFAHTWLEIETALEAGWRSSGWTGEGKSSFTPGV